MNKLVAIGIITLCALLCCTSNAHAQGTLPRIGVRKWKIELPPQLLLDWGSVALARKENKMFLGTRNGSVLVVDTRLGLLLDTIDLLSYPDIKELLPHGVNISALQVSENGALIAVSLSGNGPLLMISYPSKTLLDSITMALGQYASSPKDVFLSPKGRYFFNNGALVDRKTGYVRRMHSAQMRVSFDSAESIVAYNVPGTVSGKLCSNLIQTWRLTDTTTVPESYDVVGYPTLSADGTKLMSSGRTVSADGKWASRPMAVVMNIVDKTRLWQLSGDYSPDPSDFSTFAWNSDATLYFGIRLSTSLPRNQQNRLFTYNLGLSDPVSIVDDEELAGYSFVEVLFNSEMTEAYSATENTIFAIDLSKKAVSVVDRARQNLLVNTVYPNPTNGLVRVDYNDALRSISWRLTTMDGQHIQNGQLSDTEILPDGRAQCFINLPSNIAFGTYLLALLDSDGASLMSFVLVKQ